MGLISLYEVFVVLKVIPFFITLSQAMWRKMVRKYFCYSNFYLLVPLFDEFCIKFADLIAICLSCIVIDGNLRIWNNNLCMKKQFNDCIVYTRRPSLSSWTARCVGVNGAHYQSLTPFTLMLGQKQHHTDKLRTWT